jgi:hypothetical protein
MDYLQAVRILADEERAAIDYPDEMSDAEVCRDICEINKARGGDPLEVITPEAYGEERAEAFRIVWNRFTGA